MRLTEREARIRAKAFKEAVEIARDEYRKHEAVSEMLTEADERWRMSIAREVVALNIASAIEAAAKGGQK